MWGAIIGDIVGSRFEIKRIKTTEFQLFTEDSTFTDDTVLTVAIASAILSGGNYTSDIMGYAAKHFQAGFSSGFLRWVNENYDRPVGHNIKPYGSYGNGAAMRISPVGWAFDLLEKTLCEAEKAAACSHDHPEGIKGAKAVAHSVYLARKGRGKDYIKNRISKDYDYNLDQSLDEIRPTYEFDATCQGSVPQSIISFLESDCFESAIRNAISLGGDSDTMACMAGAIAEAHYGTPKLMIAEAKKRLPTDFIQVVDSFNVLMAKSAIFK